MELATAKFQKMFSASVLVARASVHRKMREHQAAARPARITAKIRIDASAVLLRWFVSFSLLSAAFFFDLSQWHCLSLHVLPGACWPVRFCRVVYNDVSSCFLVCADNDPMPSVRRFCFNRK